MKLFRRVAMGILSAFGVACVVWAIVAALRGNYLSAFAGLTIGIYWLIAVARWRFVPHTVARGESNSTGTTVRPDGRYDLITVAWLVMGFVGLGSFGLTAVMKRLDLPLDPETQQLFSGGFFGGAGFCLVALGVTARRRGMSYVRLTPHGFEIAELFSTKRGDWSQVAAVTNELPERPQADSPIVMVMTEGKPKFLDASSPYTSGGVALLNWVRFYHQNPDSRGELTDGRAIERLRALEHEYSWEDVS